MRVRPKRFALFLMGGMLVLGVVGLGWALGTGASEAQQGTMHNCPQAGKWSIAVWDGESNTAAGDALATCGTGAVAAAYALDPQTQVWSRWFAALPQASNTPLSDTQGVLALGSAGGPSPTATPTPAATATAMPSGTWTGVWDTNWGPMELTQSDGSVTGTYEFDQGQIQGTVEGNKLVGTWAEAPTDGGFAREGEFEFTMSPDGNSFTGRWRYDSEGDWDELSGTRIS
jgi:hypothetical protein